MAVFFDSQGDEFADFTGDGGSQSESELITIAPRFVETPVFLDF